jgi:3-hydroxyisobutyrate dehydrogenase
MPPFSNQNHTSLSEIEQQAWALLAQGSQTPGDAFYTGTLGTLSDNGVSLRTVVLRGANPLQKIVVCYSDKRATKVEEIKANPNVSFHFWDSERKIQLRLSARATIHTSDALADQHWQGASLSNRRSYLAIPAPGSEQPQPTSGLPDGLDTREPTQQESKKGRINFALIAIVVHHLDYLHLAKGGHRRAIFKYDGGKLAEASWIVP